MPPADPRKRSTKAACVPCRESKIKCDKVAPVCGCCEAKGRECRFEDSDDKRRLSLRVAMEILCKRMDQIYDFAMDSGIDIPPMDTEKHSTLLKVLHYQRLPYNILSKDLQPPDYPPSDDSPTATTSQPADANAVQSGPRLPMSMQNGNMIIQGMNDPSLSNGFGVLEDICHENSWNEIPIDFMSYVNELPPMDELPELITDSLLPTSTGSADGTAGLLSTQAEDNYGRQNDTSSTEALANQLSERIGSLHIGPLGNIRFLGPTSYFSLIESPTTETSTWKLTTRQNSNNQNCLMRIGLGKTVPAGLEEHLTNLYFAWQDPSLHVVSRSTYETSKLRWLRGQDTPYYSECLQNAICAVGAAFETRHHASLVTFPRSLAEFFGDRAKALLDTELDDPRVATVQAMVVLSSHEIGSNKDSRGWLLCGMAMRLALDLGLHVNPQLQVLKGNLTQEEADVRGNVFWGAFLSDQSWGFYLGKPIRTRTGDITVPKPSEQIDTAQMGEWRPYTDAANVRNATGVPDLINEIHGRRVSLAEIMAPVANAVYGDLSIPKKDLQEKNVETVALLLGWKTALPPLLQINEDDYETRHVPQLILLHMHYYQNVIHAHRPYMSKTYNQPSPPQGPGPGHARMMCISSAVLIAKLLRAYEIQHGFRKINVQAVGITCSAAMLLLFANVTQSSSEADLETHLSTCFRALDEFGLSWQNAKTARECLLLLQRQWEVDKGDDRPLRRVATMSSILDPTQTKKLCGSRLEGFDGYF